MKTILNHAMVRILHDDKQNVYKVQIAMRDGKTVEQAPYPADQRGLIGAMTLAIDVLAGKVLLAGLVQVETQTDKIQAVKPILLTNDLETDQPEDVSADDDGNEMPF